MPDRAVARVGLDKARTPIISGANTVFTNDAKTAHEGSVTVKGAVVVQGSTSVFVENKPIARAADLTNKEGPILAGSTNVFASDIIAATVNAKAVAQVVVTTNSYVSNPASYNNPDAAANGVKQYYAPVSSTEPISNDSVAPIGPVASSDLITFLTARLAEAAQGRWRETGQGGKPSNINITNIWRDLGFVTSSPWNTDQTAWCMGFVNYALKNCGYRWAPEASARAIQNNPSRWKATQIPINQAQPGDIVLWNFSHVSFVYTADNGRYTFVGGNQTPTSGNKNNPNDGDLTISWPSGWTLSRGGIASIWRPSKS